MTDLEIDIPDLIAHHDAYNTRGKEWAGPCPSCGGDDRCVITPPTSPRVGDRALWWCRQCRLGGDVVTWLEHSQHLTRAEAMREVGLSTDMDDAKKGVVRRAKQKQAKREEEKAQRHKESLIQDERRMMRDRLWSYMTKAEQWIFMQWWRDVPWLGPHMDLSRGAPPRSYIERRNRHLDYILDAALERARAEEDAVRRAECGSTDDL